MKIQVQKIKVTYHLQLDKDELFWLRDILQNPLHTYKTESEKDRKYRESMFLAIIEKTEGL